MLFMEKTVLAVVDVQEQPIAVIPQVVPLVASIQRVITGVRALEIPVVWTEQTSAVLGATIPDVAGLLAGLQPCAKSTFSACGCPNFMKLLRRTNRRQVLLCGIETHVAVYQSAQDLVDRGFDVYVVSDAIAARLPENHEIGLELMRDGGVKITSTEMALFELLRVAEGPAFKAILRVVK